MKNIDRIQSKIMSRSAVLRQAEQWHAAGKRIVFTNGCFDLMHKGHIDYLNRAADLGDKLVVALNTDASVSKLKGPHRPIQEESSREWVMASLGCVAAVTLFDEETPLALIQKLRPDVLVKGGDYTIDTIVGAEEVIGNGGKVEVIPFLKGYSTSRLEDKILRWETEPRKK